LAVGVRLVAGLARHDEHLGGELVLLVDGDEEAALLAARQHQLDAVGEAREAYGAVEERLAGEVVGAPRRGGGGGLRRVRHGGHAGDARLRRRGGGRLRGGDADRSAGGGGRSGRG